MSLEKFHLRGLWKQSSNMKQEIYPIYLNGRWYREIFKISLRRKKPRDYFNAFFTALFNAWRNYQNLYGNKKFITGQMTLRKPELYRSNFDNFKTDYPCGKMIFIIRKPDDWLASALFLRKSTPFSHNPVEIMEYYKVIFRQAVEMPMDDSFIIFEFEDLVLTPRTIMSAFADRLGIAWNESLLFPTCNGSPFYQNSSFKIERKSFVDTSVIGRGKELSGKILSAIDKECLDLWKEIVARKTI